MATIYSPNIVTSGLKFCIDAANVRSYSGTGTSVTDISGNGYGATLVNGVTLGSENRGRFVLDGTDDYINTTFSADIITTGFTINCAFYNTYSPADIRFLASMHVSSDANTVFRIELNQTQVGSLEFGHCYAGTAIAAQDELISNNFANNTWHNVALVWNPSGTTKYIYKNGVLDTSVSVSSRPMQFYSGATLRIGGRHDSNIRPMSGYIPFFYVYNRALSATEIEQNFNATRDRFGV